MTNKFIQAGLILGTAAAVLLVVYLGAAGLWYSVDSAAFTGSLGLLATWNGFFLAAAAFRGLL